MKKTAAYGIKLKRLQVNNQREILEVGVHDLYAKLPNQKSGAQA